MRTTRGLAIALGMLVLLLGSTASAARVQFGIQTPNQGAKWDDIQRAWKTADSLGFHSAWMFDHFLPIFGDEDGDCFEGWTMLSALAVEPSRSTSMPKAIARPRVVRMMLLSRVDRTRPT